jgi:hypothetical protein
MAWRVTKGDYEEDLWDSVFIAADGRCAYYTQTGTLIRKSGLTSFVTLGRIERDLKWPRISVPAWFAHHA